VVLRPPRGPVAAGELVLDVQPKLGARARLLATGTSNKNDPNDARSVAIAALRSAAPRPVAAENHAAVETLVDRYTDNSVQWPLCQKG
jgi:transposase